MKFLHERSHARFGLCIIAGYIRKHADAPYAL
jgi:hypothetical protein